MRSVVVLAITCGSCDAFRTSIPVAVPARLRLARRRATMETSAPPTAADENTAQSSYPGPMIPRVGGAMPEQRPGWFRVPAPGGKHTKVSRLRPLFCDGVRGCWWCWLSEALTPVDRVAEL